MWRCTCAPPFVTGPDCPSMPGSGFAWTWSWHQQVLLSDRTGRMSVQRPPRASHTAWMMTNTQVCSLYKLRFHVSCRASIIKNTFSQLFKKNILYEGDISLCFYVQIYRPAADLCKWARRGGALQGCNSLRLLRDLSKSPLWITSTTLLDWVSSVESKKKPYLIV